MYCTIVQAGIIKRSSSAQQFDLIGREYAYNFTFSYVHTTYHTTLLQIRYDTTSWPLENMDPITSPFCFGNLYKITIMIMKRLYRAPP